jgi:hypothetical protein
VVYYMSNKKNHKNFVNVIHIQPAWLQRQCWNGRAFRQHVELVEIHLEF